MGGKVVKTRLSQVAPLFQKYDSPISVAVRMAQFALESQAGQSVLFKKSNNGFGIKASAPWTGDKVLHNSMEVGGAQDSYFRKYPALEASVKDHASFFTSTPYRAETAYKQAIEATNYKDEANALTGIYAGDPLYGKKLIDIVERYDLTQYDKEEKPLTFPRPKITDRRTQALGYPGRGIYPRRSKTAIKNIVWHYTATTHAGHGASVIQAHERYWRNTHGWDIGGYHYYIDRHGNIFWNYDLEICTYGASAANPYTMHISLEASSVNNYTNAQVKAREDLTLWLLTNDLKHLTGQSMRGHKEVPGNSTACPGYSVAQLQAFRDGLDAKLAKGSHNPQGLNEVETEAYTEPRLPFDKLEVGDIVTLSPNWSWYNPSNGKLMISKRYDELIGTTDKIIEIKEIEPVNQSKVIYKLEKYNSWILQEFLDESKASWELVPTDPKEEIELKEGEYLDHEGNVWLWKKKEN